ncbi:MAG: SMP-30/gluconolactonase/LRE family protein [Spirochaetales bacterium]|uniref:SMP-30/gluconolactonase/LRE family protein n=1 Tax=Candidatus Thalassospirochaeta sargassi TaxID=3119039 RepID=A0AAJ1IFN8_9SPIO|nr:SMP-30/gluconolactonase/LRE family protein [Spirochaetales bacterium]
MFNLLEKGPFDCGETPLWDEQSGSVIWVDASSNMIYSREIDSGRLKSYNTGLPVSAIRKAEDGNFYLLTKWGLYLWSRRGSGIVIGGRDFLDSGDTLRFNDGVPLAGAGFIAGTFDEADLSNDRGAFYRINLNGGFEVLDTGLHVTNGIAEDSYGNYYLSEMYRNRILRYEVSADGSVGERIVHIEFNDDEGKPDGLLCDKDDNLWVAHWLGWKLSCWSRDGERLREVRAPIASPTCFCFADSEEKSLYVTTATLELTEGDFKKGPDAGALFRLDL